ncbi:hypothetical protein Cgig2_013782 [Carnegiea gigantea]|uniref:DUF4283 domain-containing protein n=1 Tax=Carnegiea gigantea TaxID=171969 RepID=A0A9Q1QEM7_9CARY|nr:hypothetical protein Cgig2_013782 [Carnegiea gigantea]
MADELMIEREKLKLTKEEEEAADYKEEIPKERKEEIALSLFGKFLTPSTFSTKAMKTVMQAVWRPSRGMVVKELDKNLFLFQFFLKKDKDFALDEGPWAFNGHLLIKKEWTGIEQLSDIVFDKTGFWVKAYDVRAVRKTRAFARFLGDKVGTFLRCDDNELLGTEKALCFRAEVDVLKPLRRGIMVKIDGKALWIKFKYLKLPDFCYGCEVLGHTVKTKRSKMEMETILVQLGDYHCAFVDARGRSGGLALLWDKNLELTVVSYSSRHINATLKWHNQDPLWRFTRVYGWLKNQQKHRTGEMIADLKTHMDLPWLVGGDLNEIFYHSEKAGRPPRAQTHIDAFRDACLDNDLHDLGFSGCEFTWCNKREGAEVVEGCLDRFCPSTEWSIQFPGAQVQHMDSYISDHPPILLRCKPRNQEVTGRGSRF